MRLNKNQRRLDFLFLITSDLESPAGIGRYFPISKSLANLGYDVNIATLHSRFHLLEKKKFVKDGVKINYVAQMHVQKEGNQTYYYNTGNLIWHTLKATWKLLVHVLKNPAETIIIGKPHPMNSIAGLLGGAIHRTKIILDCDDYEAESNHFSSPWQKKVVVFFENTVPKLVNLATTNTYFNKNRMINLGVPAEKIFYLPNGIDPERFRNLDPSIELEIKQNFNFDDKKVIAYIGSLSLANHPVDLLIRAFKGILKKEPNTFLLIVGGGKDIEKLKALSKDLELGDNVSFTGRVQPDLVPYYYKLAHVTVDPVVDDYAAKGRCPLKMFESWAMGIPFITADVGDRRTLLVKFQNNTLTKPDDHLDLEKKIINIFNDEQISMEIVKYYRERVKDFYWDEIIANNMSIFNY